MLLATAANDQLRESSERNDAEQCVCMRAFTEPARLLWITLIFPLQGSARVLSNCRSANSVDRFVNGVNRVKIPLWPFYKFKI